MNYLLISAYSGLLKFEMEMFVRLHIGQLFTQSARRGHTCTLDTFLVLVDLSFLGPTGVVPSQSDVLYVIDNRINKSTVSTETRK